MNFMERVFASVSDLYKDINPAQLSGANDVIVVEAPGSIRSTGFYAKFGNVYSFKTSREVILTVNDAIVNIDTRIDKDGHVFFSLHGGGSQTPTGLLDYSAATGFRTMQMLIDSPANYNYLLANHQRIYECLLNDRYLFSECLFKDIEGRDVREIFSAGKIHTFLGSAAIVVGLMERTDRPEFLMSFPLFAELYFCVERRPSADIPCCSPESLRARRRHSAGKSGEEKNPVGMYMMKQLLRKKVCPKHPGKTGHRLVQLPEKYLRNLNLQPGPNKAAYRLSGTPVILNCTVYFWSSRERVVVSDIDGTVTKSDVMGYIYGAIGKDWTHSGIAALYSRIVENGYKVVYLSSRPIGHIGLTKAYLGKVRQETHTLPPGPVFLFPGRLLSAIYREVILGPEEFKISTISEIKEILGDGELFAGFGNKESDRLAYEMCDIDTGRIFIVNPHGEVLTGKGIVRLSHRTLYEVSDGVFPPFRPETPNVSQKYIGQTWWRLPPADDT